MRNFFRVFRSPLYCHALARRLKAMGVPYLPRLIDYFVRFYFACWLPHEIQIGRNFELGYGGLGCVIHPDTVFGDNVHIGTHVTIGGNARVLGTPRIGNNVYIAGGVHILGPVTVGDGSIVGANTVITRNVAARTVVAGSPPRVLHENIEISEYLNRPSMYGKKE